MENNMELEFTQVPQEKPRKENGLKERESHGFEKFLSLLKYLLIYFL